MSDGGELRIVGLDGLPEVRPGDDLGGLVAEAIERAGTGLREDDVLVVTHKIVSKAEGRLVRLPEITPSALATAWAERWGKDARQVEVTLREARRIVRMERGIIIAETEHGFVCANAGVDASNVEAETVCLLPRDPDASAARLRDEVGVRFGLPPGRGPGVVVSDSFGRPWRNGIVNVAIGVAGLPPLADYRGMHDAAGYELHVTVLAIADELAAAAELVMHKLAARPVALVRGYVPAVDSAPGRGSDLVMDAAKDLFR